MQANVAHDIASRGLAFYPDDEFVSLMKKAGADASVLSALKTARVGESNPEVKPDPQLLRQLSDAAVLMKADKYADANKNRTARPFFLSYCRSINLLGHAVPSDQGNVDPVSST